MISIIIISFLLTLTIADPVPSGGANCTQDIDCGGVDAGKCVNNTCKCPPQFANVSCSYKRQDAVVPGALNIALPFIGVGGVGNFIIGRTGPAVAQLILMLTVYIILIPTSIIMCGGACCGKAGKIIGIGLGTVIIIAAILAGLGGFIWSIIDGAYMLEGKLADGNGFNLFIK